MAKGKTRKEKIPARLLRARLSSNVEFLAKRKLPGKNVPVEISNATKVSNVNPVSRANVQRILKNEIGVSLEQLQALADGFGVLPHDLLDPNLEAHYVQESVSARRKVDAEDTKSTSRGRRTRRDAPPVVS